jgi:ABC-type transport system involved in multi-copper enzyme maturation permease subunit
MEGIHHGPQGNNHSMSGRFTTLLWKEWMGLRPFAILIVALCIMSECYESATSFSDMRPIWDSELIGSNSGIGLLIFSVIISLGILVREQDDGTLLYLDGLPLSRHTVYLAKWTAATALTAASGYLDLAIAIGYEFLSRTSISPPFPWRSMAVLAGLMACQAAFLVSLMFFLSIFRRWALLLLGGLLFLVYLLKSLQFPYAVFLDPLELVQKPGKMTDLWVVPWNHLGALFVMSAVFYLMGLLCFSIRPGSFSAIRRGRWATLQRFASMILLPLAAVGMLGALVMHLASSEEDDPSPAVLREYRPPPSGGNEILQTQSAHFEFIHRKRDTWKVNKLMPLADGLFLKVADFLETPEGMRGVRIVVDTTSNLSRHTAGQAHWKKIRMGLNRDEGRLTTEAILGHELTHVLTDQLTDDRLQDEFGATRWFHEGLASYVEYRFFQNEETKQQAERGLALAASWGEVDFAELVDNDELSKLRDANLVYPAGMFWLMAAVDVYGDDAPAKLLRAIARPDAPRKLEGLVLWRDTCLAAGFDLERIRSRFRVTLTEIQEKHRAMCARFPEITEATVTKAGGEIVIRPKLAAGWNDHLPAGSHLVCLIRPDEDADRSRMRHAELDENGEFRIPSYSFVKPQLGYQIGWSAGEWREEPVFGEWTTTRVIQE